MTIKLIQGDCLEKMKDIQDGSVDLILQDAPYNTTACKWEWDIMTVIDELWSEWKRILKPNGAVVMTASQPFTTKLIASNYEMFKYCWVWEKSRGTGHVHAKNKPLKQHEDIVVFSKGVVNHANLSKNRMVYIPQMTIGKPYIKKATEKSVKSNVLHKTTPVNLRQIGKTFVNNGTRYPKSIIKINSEHNVNQLHPTQKPVALMEYLIKTYTNEGETVFDGFMGSGTTMVAAKNLNRRGIGIEMDSDYFKIAQDRIEDRHIHDA